MTPLENFPIYYFGIIGKSLKSAKFRDFNKMIIFPLKSTYSPKKWTIYRNRYIYEGVYNARGVCPEGPPLAKLSFFLFSFFLFLFPFPFWAFWAWGTPPSVFFPDSLYRPACVLPFSFFLFGGRARHRASPGRRGAPKDAKIIKIDGVSLGKSKIEQIGGSESLKFDGFHLKSWKPDIFTSSREYHLQLLLRTLMVFGYLRGQKSDPHCKR